MPEFYVEITDTFGGERYSVTAKDMKQAFNKVRTYRGSAPGWRKTCDGELTRYDHKDFPVCMFIQYADEYTPKGKAL
jgi:hypothetical protein